MQGFVFFSTLICMHYKIKIFTVDFILFLLKLNPCNEADTVSLFFLFDRIARTRIKNGIPCFEIEWQKPGWCPLVQIKLFYNAIKSMDKNLL